jgi:hypothetical protein
MSSKNAWTKTANKVANQQIIQTTFKNGESVERDGSKKCKFIDCKAGKKEYILSALFIVISILDIGFLINSAYFTSCFLSNLTFLNDEDYVIQMCANLFIVYSLVLVIIMIFGFIACFKKIESLKHELGLKIYLVSMICCVLFDSICGVSCIGYGATTKTLSIQTFFCCSGSFLILMCIFKIPADLVLYRNYYVDREDK